MQQLKALTEERRNAVADALQATFDLPAADLEPLSGGVSGALIFKVVVRNHAYVLRIEPDRVARVDRERNLACMSAAALAGVAPPVYFANSEMGISIMDFVAGKPLSTFPGGSLGLTKELAKLVCKIQLTPTFPMLGNYPEAIGGMLNKLNNSGLALHLNFDQLLQAHSAIESSLFWDENELVSAHNDLNPRNLIFDGQRVWIIDWELAFRNDPLVDLAILTTELAETPQLETVLLEARFGNNPDRFLLARLIIIRLLTRLFYGCIVLESLGGAAEIYARTVRSSFTPKEFRAAVEGGKLASGSAEAAYAFSKMSLDAFIAGVSDTTFNEALKLVGAPLKRHY